MRTQNTPKNSSTNKHTLVNELKALLRQDLADLDLLNTRLTEETEALKQRDAGSIKSLASAKSQLVNTIETRAKAKAKILGHPEIGVRPGQVSAGVAQLLDTELTELWQTSLENLENCQSINKVNGLVITRSLQRTQKIINIVRGQSTAPKLYGNQGNEVAYSGSQGIAKA